MTIDPRLAERRQEVAEDRARRNIRRLLKFLLMVGLVGGVVWLFLSPYLSIHEVRAAGISQSKTRSTLVENHVIPGTPMIFLRAGALEDALMKDPWVAEATVELRWPNTVVVKVVERIPAAWVQTSDGWSRRAIDGVAVPSKKKPDQTLGWVRLPSVTDQAAMKSRTALGAIEFLAALPVELQIGSVVTLEADGELWARSGGYRVRLGRPEEMTAKALSLVALLQEAPPQNSILVLIAPTHPAVTPPQTAGGSTAGKGKKSGADGSASDGDKQ